jgi:serine beta-lactamase-like protein LACTB
MSLRYGLRLLAIVILTVGLADAQTIPPATAKHIDEIVAKAITEQQIPAISVAIALNGQMQYQKAFGKADLENNVSATPETLFRTGSIAKPMTAVAAMRLVEDGKLDLDAPIQKYCPAFPQKPWTITAREVLGHISGVRQARGTGTAATTSPKLEATRWRSLLSNSIWRKSTPS